MSDAELHGGGRKTAKGPARTGDVNIRDIAAAAGVSVATVSRVMRSPDKVANKTRTKVEEAIARLGYVPNAHALALTTPPNSVTLVVDSIQGGTYSEMAAGVERESAERGMTFRLISTGGNWDDPVPMLNELLSQRPRVAVLTASDAIDSNIDSVLNEYVDKFASIGASLVVLARPRKGLDGRIGVIDYANESGMRELTEYMISLGHRRFAFVGKREASSVFMARYRGFREALIQNGIDYDESCDIAFTDDRDSMMANVMTAWRSGALNDVTAFVAATDAMALYAIAGLGKCGVRVPGDASVAGFDDMPFAEDLVVPMTTVHAPFGTMGRTAVRMGLEGVENTVVMPTRLVVRGSVIPVR